MARRRPVTRGSRRRRQGMFVTLLEGAGGIMQTVAVEVVPEVVDAVDMDAVLQHVDVQALLERIDLDALLERVDLTRLLERVDLNAVLERVDIDALLSRTELGEIMSRSGGAIATRTLDMVRSQGVGLDGFVDRWTDRVLRRRDRGAAKGPPLLVGDQPHTAP